MEFLEPLKIKEYSGQPVTIAQVKFDGYYAEVYKDKDIIFICTKKQEINLWPKLVKNRAIHKQVLSLPDNTILRCELHCPGVPATSVPTLINEANERLLLSPFRIEMWNNRIPSVYTFEENEIILTDYGFVVPPIRYLSSTPIPLSDNEIKELKEDAKAKGVEGWVLKDKVLGNSWKLKPQKTVDAFVVSYAVSDSDTYAGGLKSVDIAVWGDGLKKNITIATVGTGFDAEYRMSVDMKSLIGRVGEFKYQTIGAKGRLIFPRFLRWRDDEKKKDECTIDQLKGV